MEHSALKLHAFPHTQILALVDNLFRGLDSNLRVTSDRLGSIQRTVHALLRSLEDSRRESPVIRVLSAEVLSCEDELHSSALANRARQALTAACARDSPQLDLRLSKVRFNTAIQHISHHGKLAAASERVAVDSADDGFLDERRQFGPRLDEVGSIGVGEGFGRHFFDVCAGGEGFLAAG